MNNRAKVIIQSTLFFDVLIIDQLTKCIALKLCAIEQVISSFLTCHITFNRGISWGMLHHADESIFWLITILIAMITLYIAYLGWRRMRAGEWAIGYVLVVAGSISNVIDRIIYGGVVDFIAFSFGGWEFPVFNVADMCIVGGVGIIMVSLNSFDKLRTGLLR